MESRHELKWVIEAKNLGNYTLQLMFNDGRLLKVDCKPMISKYSLFAPLKDKDVFDDFSLDGWTVTWLDGKIDVAPEYLYVIGKAV